MAMGHCISSMSSQVECLERLEKGLELLESARPGRAGTGRDSRDPGDWRKMSSALFVEEDVPVLSMCCYFVVLFFFVGYSRFSKYTRNRK